MSQSFELGEVESATIGTVGPPGQRVFFLRARSGGQSITLKMEKQQVAALAQLVTEILSDLPSVEAPERYDEEPSDIDPAWSVGTMQLGYDTVADRIVLVAGEALAAAEGDEDEVVPVAFGEDAAQSEGATASMALTRSQAAGLVARSEELLEGGRQICPLCGYPMDPEGHSCPRTNGHRAPSL